MKSSLSCLFLNARSIVKFGAYDALLAYCALHSLDIVMVAETWLTSTVSNQELSGNGVYHVFRRDRGSTGGGVCVLVKSDITCKEITTSFNCELVCAEIFANSATVRVVCVYLSNSGNYEDRQTRVQVFCEALSFICDTDAQIIVGGDFNLPAIDWKNISLSNRRTMEASFVNACISNGLEQLVNCDTRIDYKGQGSVLDLLLTSDAELVENISIEEGPVLSDHKIIRFTYLVPSYVKIMGLGGYNFWKGNYERMGDIMDLVCWPSFFSLCSSVNDMYNCFVAYMHALIERFVPFTHQNRSNRKLQDYIAKLKREIDENVNKDDALHKKLRKATLRLRILEESKLSFRNVKSFYRYANKRLKGRETIGALEVGNKLVTHDEEKCSVFREFFSSVYVPSSTFGPRDYLCSNSASSSMRFSALDVETELRGLPSKCSHTPDGIPQILLKRLARSVAEPLYLIFQRSYCDGKVPRYFTQSVVTPVFKKGSKSLVKNYRPVAQESVACVVFEKLLVKHITHHLSVNGLCDNEQHGFVKGKSTATQLVEMTHEWSLLINQKKCFDVIYFDFSKAFDSVDHGLLLGKLTQVAIDTTSLNWIQNYLTNRTFCVKIGNLVSLPAPCPSGVPQGSSIGPLLFSIFISDIGQNIPAGVSYKLYADDLKLYAAVDCADQRALLQSAIDGISSWSKKNNMSIAIHKCIVLKNSKSDSGYFLDGTQIPEHEKVRDLGLTLEPRLDFSSHITNVIRSASTLVNTIFRTFIIARANFYIQLYKALVLPKFLYCCEVWRPHYKKYIEALEHVQNKFVKRLTIRCNIDRNKIDLDSIATLHRNADMRMYNRLKKSGALNKYFDIRANNLRSRQTVCSREVARTEAVNNMFAWRMARQLREDKSS